MFVCVCVYVYLWMGVMPLSYIHCKNFSTYGRFHDIGDIAGIHG